MTKHFPGGGPQKDGEDPHFAYGREQVYPGGQLRATTCKPFEAAFDAGTSQIMPYYGMPIGTEYEEVGFGFNKSRHHRPAARALGFDGIVCTDWGLLSDAEHRRASPSRPAPGASSTSPPRERMVKVLEAGVDQFGGEAIPELLVELVRSGEITEARLDVSARRLLREKFVLGLFDAPFVDVERGRTHRRHRRVPRRGRGRPARIDHAADQHGPTPPARPSCRWPRGIKVYVEGIDRGGRRGLRHRRRHPGRGRRRDRPPAGAVRAARHACSRTSSTPAPLDFPDESRSSTLVALCRHGPDRDRRVPRPPGHPHAARRRRPRPSSPTSAPARAPCSTCSSARRSRRAGCRSTCRRSMDAVEGEPSDVPFDTDDPLFRFGHGLGYGTGS